MNIVFIDFVAYMIVGAFVTEMIIRFADKPMSRGAEAALLWVLWMPLLAFGIASAVIDAWRVSSRTLVAHLTTAFFLALFLIILLSIVATAHHWLEMTFSG